MLLEQDFLKQDLTSRLALTSSHLLPRKAFPSRNLGKQVSSSFSLSEVELIFGCLGSISSSTGYDVAFDATGWSGSVISLCQPFPRPPSPPPAKERVRSQASSCSEGSFRLSLFGTEFELTLSPSVRSPAKHNPRSYTKILFWLQTLLQGVRSKFP